MTRQPKARLNHIYWLKYCEEGSNSKLLLYTKKIHERGSTRKNIMSLPGLEVTILILGVDQRSWYVWIKAFKKVSWWYSQKLEKSEIYWKSIHSKPKKGWYFNPEMVQNSIEILNKLKWTEKLIFLIKSNSKIAFGNKSHWKNKQLLLPQNITAYIMGNNQISYFLN